MNMPDAQSMAGWMDPGQWKSWMPNPDALANIPLPGAALLREAGATVKPEVLETLKNEYMAELGALWQQLLEGRTPEIRDRRFAAPAWTANPVTAFSAAAYLLNGKFLLAMADAVEASTQQKQKIRFAIQQVVDAMSPANFLATNPEAQQALIESKGESLTRGLKNMLADMQKGQISLSDDKAFEVGRNLATTEGLTPVIAALKQLVFDLEGTKMRASGSAKGGGLAIYNEAHSQADRNIPGAQAAFNDMHVQYMQIGNDKPNDDDKG